MKDVYPKISLFSNPIFLGGTILDKGKSVQDKEKHIYP